MNLARNKTLLGIFAATLVLAGCAGGALQRARQLDRADDLSAALEDYNTAIANDSTRATLYFERGYVEYRLGRFAPALRDFGRARTLDPGEPAHHLYFAIAADTLGQIDEALAGYGEFLSRHPKGQLADIANARTAALTQEKLRNEIANALAREDTLTAVPNRTVVAVLAPDGSALPDHLKPLALALADFAATDLKQVNSISVVERRRIDALQKELALAEAGLVDPQTAPRAGRLLGAGTLLGGRLALLSDSSLRYDGVAFGLSGTRSSLPLTDPLHNFLTLEKNLVFSFLDTLGVQLTRAERDAIGKPPTESFLAVLAYAKGLEAERNGDWAAARSNFSEARSLDPGFGAARVQEAQARSRLSAAASGGAAQTAETINRKNNVNRPLLRSLTRFGPPPGDEDSPYTAPVGVTRTVIIEVNLPAREQ